MSSKQSQQFHFGQRRRYERWIIRLAIAVVITWLWILIDLHASSLLLLLLLGLTAALAILGVTMLLGLVGFGVCAAGDRAINWVRKASSWPDE
jgi:hypothetical protein